VLRGNLSTRPFYNERAVQLLLLLAGVAVAALTLFNVTRIISLSRQNTQLASSTSSEREESARLRRDAATIRGGINQAELKTIVAAAEEANILIDQRTFSWTAFFNRIEETLPADVMLTEVQPSFQENHTVISMMVLGRRTEDVDEFVEKLEATGAFEQVLPKQHDKTDDGLTRVLITSIYNGEAVEEAKGEAPPAKEPKPAASPTKPVGGGKSGGSR
jgi:Tfp pilus assembly protein PilN